MFEVIGLIGLLMDILGKDPDTLEMVSLLSWQDKPIFVLPQQPDPVGQKKVQNYIQSLSRKGIATGHQGVWLQTDFANLGNHQGTTPVTAASLTKIATTLAALQKWGTDHRFETLVYADGEIKAGVLQGDLIIQGGADPFFVWEEAMSMGNALNQLGIRQVTGNLVITDKFYMNYNANAQKAGQLLKQGLDSSLWSGAAATQYRSLPQGTPRPQLKIQGQTVVEAGINNSPQLLLRHQSMNLAEILKQMNIFSNNKMSEMLAQGAGGASEVAKIAAQAARVPQEEIRLVNGSGLGLGNRISPRAATAMLLAIERLLMTEPLNVTDLFPVAGRDRNGTMINRRIPGDTAVKTGTLAEVSALAGVLPTRDRGLVWFAIINHGRTIEQFRAQQDIFLQSLIQQWGSAPVSAIKVSKSEEWLGDPKRNVK